MKFPLYIAKRYLFTKSKNNAINFISGIAAFGIIIGSASLFIVLSGFAGLKDFSLQFASVVDPDLKLFPVQGKSITLKNDQLKALSELEGVASYAKILEERVVLNNDTKNEIVTLKGVDTAFPQSTIDSILVQGQWMESEMPQIVSGWGVSRTLDFGVFDFNQVLKVYVPKPGKGQLTSVKGAYNAVNVANAGLFQINEDLDYNLVFTTLETAQHLLEYSPQQVSSLEITTHPDANLEQLTAAIAALFDQNVIVKNRAQLNDALYKMLNTENLAVYLIFTLILIIALFNVIGSIIMMILDKKKNLHTLYNLGTSIKDIRRIFFLQGSLMSILGGLVGLIIGFVLILNQIYGPEALKIMITPSLAYPATIEWENIVLVLLTISILGVLASKLASARITKKLVTSA